MFRRFTWFMVSWALLMGCRTAAPLPPPKVVPPIGSRVELAAGDVWFTADNEKRRLITGAMLPARALLTLDPGARALIRLTDGTAVFLRDNTALCLAAGAVRLEKGEIWVDVPAEEGELKRFVTGGVTITASGAGFDVSSTKEGVEVYVARGLAIVDTKGGRAEVASGEKAVISNPGSPLTVKPVKYFADWTGGMADNGLGAAIAGRATGRIYGIDRQRPGALPTELDIQAQDIQVVIRDGIAHTTVDQRFFNPSSVDVEGWYWFTVPEGASVERFALEMNGVLIDGEMTERKQAAEAYEEAVQRALDPALLEWVDGRNFRARIFPIPAAGERRVVLSYTQFLPFAEQTYRYVYPMGGPGEKRIQELSLQVDLGQDGKDFEIATLQNARVSEAGDLISIRRSGYLPKADFLLELKATEPAPPLRTYRFSTGGREADYLMVRYAPEERFGAVEEVPGDVVVVVDTSAGGGETERQIRSDAALAILRALSAEDRFAIVSADLTPRVIYPEKGLAPATEKDVSKATEKLAEVASAGATDLGEMFHVAFGLVHDAVQPAVVYIGDGRPTVGETDAIALTERLRRSLGDSRARLFTIAVGEAADYALLERISQMGGGRSFRIDTPEQTVQEALHFAGMVKTPTITDLRIDLGAGLDQVFSTASGKVSEGEEVVVLARSHHELPKQITVTGRLGGQPFKRQYKTDVETGEAYGYIPSLWARMYLDRLMGESGEANRGTIISLGLSYYLMTPFTSFLVLESDEAYAAAGIERRAGFRQSWNGFSDARLKNEGSLPTPMEEAGRVEAEDEALEVSYEEAAPMGMAPPSTAPPPSPSAAAKSAPRPSRPAGGTKRKTAERVPPQLAGAPKPTQRFRTLEEKGVCSDAAKRPLAQRRVLWIRKLNQATTPSDWADVFFDAAAKCELARMQDRKSLLSLIEAKAHTADEITAILSELSGVPSLQRYLRKRIIRRTLSFEYNDNLYESSGINWYEVERGIGALKTAEERLKKIRELLESHPDDAFGRVLLVDALIETGEPEAALEVALRLKRDGLAGIDMLETICDLQAETDPAEAKRTCSEIVELSDADPAARGRLGDLFLRHGWFDAAYRQYRTLVALQSESPEAHLRLAMAAAGMERVDEALRIERRVSTFDGEEGPKDPRRFARLHSAVRLARMIAESAPDSEQRAELSRSLKRTQLFTEPTTMVLLTWQDLGVPLSLRASKGKTPVTVADDADARETGLYMLNLGRGGIDGVTLEVHIEQAPVRRPVPVSVIIITYDGDTFRIENRTVTLPARAQSIGF